MVKTVFASFFVVLISSQALAGLMIEPYVGYESGTLKATTVGGGDVGGTGNAIDVGARIAWKFFGLWAGVDYMIATGGKTSPSTAVAGTDVTYTKNDLGVSLGYDFPIKIRTYATYVLNPSWKQTSTTAGVATDTTYSGGTSWKLGLGYSLIMWLTANFEYYNNSPSKLNTAGVSSDVSTNLSTFTESGFRLVISFPVSF